MKIDNLGYNPGKLMELYLRLVSDVATMEWKKDGLLFDRSRVPCSKLDLHDPNNSHFYSENCPIGEKKIAEMRVQPPLRLWPPLELQPPLRLQPPPTLVW